MKKEMPSIKIANPSPKRWDELIGDSKCRFCEHCNLHVQNLSAMTERERNKFLAARAGVKTCITYAMRPDGTMISESFWSRVFRPVLRLRVAAMAVLATVVPFWFSSCATKRTLVSELSGGNSCASGNSGDSGKSGKDIEVVGEYYEPSSHAGSTAFPSRPRPGEDLGWGHPPVEEPFEY